MSNDSTKSADEIRWWNRLAFGILGATATLAGPWLRAYVGVAGTSAEDATRNFPVVETWSLIIGWAAVWVLSGLVVTYQKETNHVSLAVTALGMPGTFAGVSVLMNTAS